ncbi:MAG: insulinase family protein [Myxococcales bacterium]|nr:insulinase family protein [Myxococcales bacterium]
MTSPKVWLAALVAALTGLALGSPGSPARAQESPRAAGSAPSVPARAARAAPAAPPTPSAISGATPGAAAYATVGPRIDYRSFTLANGLRVHVIEDDRTPMVHEVLWVKVGSKDEQAKRTGFAHLFEHLMFKGSAHIPDGKLDLLLEAAGGWSNAFTSSDMTVYQNVAAANFLEQVLWIEADRLAGLLDTFDVSKLDNQREVVLNERRQSYENQPYGMAELLLQAQLWPKGHGYHWPTIGYPEDLRAATVADVASFFRTYYVPQNATMVIAGAVRFDEVKRLVEKYFAWMPRGAAPVRPRHATPAPLTSAVELTATDDVQVPRVYLTWRGPAAYSPDEPALDLALAILGEGKTSRLYKRLVYDGKLAQDVSAELAPEELAGTVRIEVTAKPGVDPARLVREVSEEISRLATSPPDAAALERAQATYESGFLSALESALQRAITLAEYDVLAKDPDYFPKDLARYRAVTAPMVQAAVARYLQPSARVVLTIAPKAGAKAGSKTP